MIVDGNFASAAKGERGRGKGKGRLCRRLCAIHNQRGYWLEGRVGM
jgi:hypothetical protein